VWRKLFEMDHSLHASRKTLEGSSSVERDEQFRCLNRLVKQFLRRGDPVLSVDRNYLRLGAGPAIPYGAYDAGRNQGFVNVGMAQHTAEFAVESLHRRWRLIGRRHYATARAMLLCADGGGSNGFRNRAWRYYVQHLAGQLGVEVTVCHYPPGTSKWKKVEHRLLSSISLNWKGQPLVSHETVINLIGATQTKGGLRVKAALDAGIYELGVKIRDAEMERLNLRPHRTLPQWNYTLRPHEKYRRRLRRLSTCVSLRSPFCTGEQLEHEGHQLSLDATFEGGVQPQAVLDGHCGGTAEQPYGGDGGVDVSR